MLFLAVTTSIRKLPFSLTIADFRFTISATEVRSQKSDVSSQ